MQLVDQLIEAQKKKLLLFAQTIVPTVTEEDLWQPNDFTELEMHPHFRYEEGFLHALLSVKAALAAEQAEKRA